MSAQPDWHISKTGLLHELVAMRDVNADSLTKSARFASSRSQGSELMASGAYLRGSASCHEVVELVVP